MRLLSPRLHPVGTPRPRDRRVPDPEVSANSREDQCVTPNDAGRSSSVAAMIGASSIVLGRPLRGRSVSPPSPSAANRSRHLIAVGRDAPTKRAAPEIPFPVATANTISARSRWPANTVEERLQDSSVRCSSSLIASAGCGHARHLNATSKFQLTYDAPH
jgi:hypothetical protein